MTKPLDITGHRSGRLVAIRWSGKSNARGNRLWLCQCDCGNTNYITTVDQLRSKHVKSCGCDQFSGLSQYRHGGTHTHLYSVWCNMFARCTNPNNNSYKDYGGRGIKICKRWNDFANFLADVGQRPHPDLSFDRIDNDGNYEPGNVHWATKSEQMKNRRKGWNRKQSAETRKKISEAHLRRRRALSHS